MAFNIGDTPPYFRSDSASYVPDLRPAADFTRSARPYEGGTEPCDVNGQQLATIINLALRVGGGTATRRELTELVAPLGVRRTT